MSETIEKMETVEQAAEEKRYTFRKLSSDDLFLMLGIMGKIGVKELKNCFGGKSIEMLLENIKANGTNTEAAVGLGVSFCFDAVEILLKNLPKCSSEIYALLAQVADGSVSEAEIRDDAILLVEMLTDFVKKPEFPGFFRVVSKLFK